MGDQGALLLRFLLQHGVTEAPSTNCRHLHWRVSLPHQFWERERESCKFHDIPEHWDLFSSSKKGVFQSEGKKIKQQPPYTTAAQRLHWEDHCSENIVYCVLVRPNCQIDIAQRHLRRDSSIKKLLSQIVVWAYLWGGCLDCLNWCRKTQATRGSPIPRQVVSVHI